MTTNQRQVERSRTELHKVWISLYSQRPKTERSVNRRSDFGRSVLFIGDRISDTLS